MIKDDNNLELIKEIQRLKDVVFEQNKIIGKKNKLIVEKQKSNQELSKDDITTNALSIPSILSNNTKNNNENIDDEKNNIDKNKALF